MKYLAKSMTQNKSFSSSKFLNNKKVIFPFIFFITFFLTSCSSGLTSMEISLCKKVELYDVVPENNSKWYSELSDYYFDLNASKFEGEELDKFIAEDALFKITHRLVMGKAKEIVKEISNYSSQVSNSQLQQILIDVNSFSDTGKNDEDLEKFYFEKLGFIINFCFANQK